LGRHGIRVQFEGSDGERYTIKVEGRLSRDKVLHLMDMYELLGQEKAIEVIPADTKYGRIKALVAEEFILKQFTSDQIRDAFESKYSQPIKLAEVSTYLSRMNNQGDVMRQRRGRKWLYTLTSPNQVETSKSDLQKSAQFNKIIER
jgi:hypothetical protein